MSPIVRFQFSHFTMSSATVPDVPLTSRELWEELRKVRQEYEEALKRPNCSIPTHYLFDDAFACVTLYKRFKINPFNATAQAATQNATNTSLRQNPCSLVVPICVDLDEKTHTTGRTNYGIKNTELRHWVLGVIHRESRVVEIYDSLAIPWVADFWGKILIQWMKEYHDPPLHRDFPDDEALHKQWVIRSLQKPVQKQDSVTCGYYSVLFYRLVVAGYTFTQVETSPWVCDEALAHLFPHYNVATRRDMIEE
jgi:hypothetical protein